MESFAFSQPRRAHLIGIAGNGMRALADVLIGWGWSLSGSDLEVARFSKPGGADILVCHGVRLFEGHAAEHLPPETEVVVYSDAVPAENPERRRAAELGIPMLSYFQMLGRLSVGHNTVAIAGTHGKSTTAAMTTHLMIEAGLDPTVVYGAAPLGKTSGGRAGRVSPRPLGEGSGVRAADSGRWSVASGQCEVTSNLQSPISNPFTNSPHPNPLPKGEGTGDRCLPKGEGTGDRCLPKGKGTVFLVEACEYRANFLHLRPQQAAILGIEPDHFDCYDSLDQLENAFRTFAESIPSDGSLVARHDCQSTRRVTAGLKCRIESFGFSADADWAAQIIENTSPGESRFEIHRFGRRLCEVRLPVPGRHNILNALAAAALAYGNGVSADQISEGLGNFPGLHRRLEVLGTWRGATLIDDYAHHPTEVAATLAAIRETHPHARVWCVFQPHQASRTARLLDEFAASLQNADNVLLAAIFRAREGNPRPGEVTSADLARRAAELGVQVLPGHTDQEIHETLSTRLAPGDVLVTLGAGDVRKFQPRRREGD